MAGKVNHKVMTDSGTKIKYAGNRKLFLTRSVLVLTTVSLLFIHIYFFRNYITDDAFISFRYLENFIEGKGLVYNPGEKVWGYTNFLWIMVLFPFAKINIDPLQAARFISVICNVLTVLIVLIAVQHTNAKSGWNIFGAILLVSQGAYVLQSMSGLETSFFTFLVLVSLLIQGIAVKKKRPSLYYVVGLFIALAALTRPEGLLLFGVLLLQMVIYKETVGLPLKRVLQGYLLGFIPVVLIFGVSMFCYYGVFWPNSINAKVGFSQEQLLRGLRYFQVFAFRCPSHVFLLLTTGIFFRKANFVVKSIFYISVFFIVLNILAGGDWMCGYRLFHTVIPLIYLLVPFCMSSIKEALQRNRGQAGYILQVLPIILMIIFIVINAANSKLDPRVRKATQYTYVHKGIKIGKWMRDNLDADSLLATNTGGTIAYYSKLPIVDMMGINDTTIANRKCVPKQWKGIEKGDGKYVLSRRPQYIQLSSSAGLAEPRFLSGIEIYQSEEFWNNYDLAEYHIDEETTLLIYKRREKERLTELSEENRKEIRSVVDEKMRNSAFRY